MRTTIYRFLPNIQASIKNFDPSKQRAKIVLATVLGSGGTLALCLERSAADADRFAHPPKLVWPHDGWFQSYDCKSIRRGYEVYKKVCASCHGCFTVSYNSMIGVCMTKEEAKAEAKRAEILDGPNDEGKMFLRPGTLADALPEPYANKFEAAYKNAGKAPPNLGTMAFARHGHENYIFGLLTGYMDPPTGYKVEDGLYFNIYFRGGKIAMPPPLYDGVITYSCGTPATKSQMAKDVACFLRWAVDPHHDNRKRNYLKFAPLMLIQVLAVAVFVRHRFMYLATTIKKVPALKK